MIFKKKIYKVEWKDPALIQLYSLVNFELAEKIYKEVNNILAVNPYGNFKDKVNIENLKTNIKSLKGNLKHSFRIQIGDYRILYDVLEDEVLISIFRVKHRLQEDVYSDKDFLEN